MALRKEMKYFELKCVAFLKKDIDYMDSFDILSKYDFIRNWTSFPSMSCSEYDEVLTTKMLLFFTIL